MTHLPRRPSRLEVRVLPLHLSVDVSYGELLLLAPQYRASQDDRESVLWFSLRVRKAIEGVRTVLMSLVLRRVCKTCHLANTVK